MNVYAKYRYNKNRILWIHLMEYCLPHPDDKGRNPVNIETK